MEKLRFGLYCSEDESKEIWRAFSKARSLGDPKLPMYVFLKSIILSEIRNGELGKYSTHSGSTQRRRTE